jgi:hypothetical protein
MVYGRHCGAATRELDRHSPVAGADQPIIATPASWRRTGKHALLRRNSQMALDASVRRGTAIGKRTGAPPADHGSTTLRATSRSRYRGLSPLSCRNSSPQIVRQSLAGLSTARVNGLGRTVCVPLESTSRKPTVHSSDQDRSGDNVNPYVVRQAEPEPGGQPTTSHPSGTSGTGDEAVVTAVLALVACGTLALIATVRRAT